MKSDSRFMVLLLAFFLPFSHSEHFLCVARHYTHSIYELHSETEMANAWVTITTESVTHTHTNREGVRVQSTGFRSEWNEKNTLFVQQFKFYYRCKPIRWYWFAILLNVKWQTKIKNCIFGQCHCSIACA